MTSFRQIQAYRRNALRSTVRFLKMANVGRGKSPCDMGCPLKPWSRSSRILMIAEVSRPPSSQTDTRTAVERVLRLTLLLWRLRCATMIETALLRILGGGLARPVDQVIERSSGREIHCRQFSGTQFLCFEMHRRVRLTATRARGSFHFVRRRNHKFCTTSRIASYVLQLCGGK